MKCSGYDQLLVAGDPGHLVQNVSYVIMMYMLSCQTQTQLTLLTKALEKSDASRGITYALYGMSANISTLIMDTLGRYLFDIDDRLAFCLLCHL